MRKNSDFSANRETNSISDFDALQIKIASPEQILSWSYGEVTRPDTINYRTMKPDRNGLFCAKIFGPVQDYTCLCGKYKKMKHHGVVCEKCGVEIISSSVRRYRMGHITLAHPALHTLHMRSNPSRIATVLNISLQELSHIVYLQLYIVLDEGMTNIKRGQLVNTQEKEEISKQYGSEVVFETGAVAIRELLKRIDLDKAIAQSDKEIKAARSHLFITKETKRRNLLESFRQANLRPEWMVITHLPVLPPDMRPIVTIDGFKTVYTELNELYCRLINRNNRLKHLEYTDAPEPIKNNEKRMIQESVDAILSNGKNGKLILGRHGKPLKSLDDELRGKTGRLGLFRNSMLGKRVDYSGRSVIAVGANLKLHQCGLPKEMAIELFRPFVYQRLLEEGIVSTIKMAKNYVDTRNVQVWSILKKIVSRHPVLLNRAPTLHRLGIQAFEPQIIEGKAILVHPLVCSAFNADFDGDQMAVHIPLSIEAQIEARTLMLSTNNILSPANGEPIMSPTQDSVFGLYYLTLDPDPNLKPIFYNSIEYVLKDLHRSLISYRTPIAIYINSIRETTTAGRLLIYNLAPKTVPFEQFNCTLDKNKIQALVKYIYYNVDKGDTVSFLEEILRHGNTHATNLGLSFGIQDLITPSNKQSVIKEAEKEIQNVTQQFDAGLLTAEETKFNHIAVWDKAIEEISNSIPQDPENNLHAMVLSGARGSMQQIRQLCGIKGLMSKPNGEIIPSPIKSCLKEGLSALEHYSSIPGSRKGLTDTAIQTGKAGHLYRKLFDTAHGVIITQEDCGTSDGITLSTLHGKEVSLNILDRILGRYTAQDFTVHNTTIPQSTLITSQLIKEFKIDPDLLSACVIRSPVTCKTAKGICKKCYGFDIAYNTEVNLGTAVGVIAAQSIGEPGTQLTMRTFHTGGAAFLTSSDTTITMPCRGYFKLVNCNILEDERGNKIVNSKRGKVEIFDENNNFFQSLDLNQGSVLMSNSEDLLDMDTAIVHWDFKSKKVYAEFNGIVQFNNIDDNPVVKTIVDSAGLTSRRLVVNNSKNIPTITLNDIHGAPICYPKSDRKVEYSFSKGAVILVEEGTQVKIGDILANYEGSASYTSDIISGLNDISNIFEVKVHGVQACVAAESGIIKFQKDTRNKIKVNIMSNDHETVLQSLTISKTAEILVTEGEFVHKGESLTSGVIHPQDILTIRGLNSLVEDILNRAQTIYHGYGIAINDKHIEVILRQMLNQVTIIQSDYPEYSEGSTAHYQDVLDFNSQLALDHPDHKVIVFERLVSGITRTALESKSFISAASFQETSRIIMDAAVKGKIDYLEGLKESAVVGKLMPAGTGYIFYKKQQEERLKKEKQVAIKDVIKNDRKN